MSVSRTITLDDLTAEEVAELFCGFDSSTQARFFNHVTEIARAWPGAGWCQQAYAIVASDDLTEAGRRAIASLADHLELAKQGA